MPEPLKRKDKDGERYVRTPEIEAWLIKLEGVETEERLRHFCAASRKSATHVPSEALVYFMRCAWAVGAKGEFEKIFRALMTRVDRSLRSVISDSRMAGAPAIREEIMSRFAERIAKDCSGRDSLLDFFEVRFDKAFAALRTSALRLIGPASVDTVPVVSDREDGTEVTPEVEAAAADFLGGSPSKLDDPAFRLELTAAIDALPNDQRRVMGLWLKGFPIDSKDPNIMTIARILKCDEKTVRNRRDRAFKALKAALQEDAL